MSKADLKYLSDELQKLREQKLYQKLRVLETEQLPVARFDGHEVINLSSNNYLGLTTHPKLKQRALAALEQFGVGSGAVRTIAVSARTTSQPASPSPGASLQGRLSSRPRTSTL